MHTTASLPAMPHTLFPTAFGTCGIAWNDAGLLGFQFPEGTDALTEQRVAAKGRTQPAVEPFPDWVQATIARVQQHLEGKVQDFAGTKLDWSRVGFPTGRLPPCPRYQAGL